MKIIPIASIHVPADRQREEFDPEALSDLCDDIALNGLQHAPVVSSTADGCFLVSGERRFRSIRDLATAGISIRYGSDSIPLDSIPVTDFGELSPRQRKILELHENVKRKDLTWPERIRAEAQLHEVRTEEAAESGRVQTYVATAEEIFGKPLKGTTEQSYASTQVRQAVVINNHLSDPDVAKAASPKEALKVIQKKATEAHYRAQASQLASVQTSSRHTLLRGDCRVLMGGLLQESFDCLLTDPPYGIDAQNFGSQVFNEHKFDDSKELWIDDMAILAAESFRICKPQSHAYVFCDPQHFLLLQGFFKDAGWSVWRTPLIWNKRGGMLPRPEHGPRRTYEAILFASKGDRPVTGVFADVIDIPRVEKTTIHPDEKPVGLYTDLLRRSVRPGQLVVDPFCGSGTIFMAANELQLTATGIEKEETSFALSAERLKGKETV